MEGKKLEKPAEEDSAWGSPGPFRSIHANEIKRKGSMGVDLGDIKVTAAGENCSKSRIRDVD